MRFSTASVTNLTMNRNSPLHRLSRRLLPAMLQAMKRELGLLLIIHTQFQ